MFSTTGRLYPSATPFDSEKSGTVNSWLGIECRQRALNILLLKSVPISVQRVFNSQLFATNLLFHEFFHERRNELSTTLNTQSNAASALCCKIFRTVFFCEFSHSASFNCFLAR